MKRAHKTSIGEMFSVREDQVNKNDKKFPTLFMSFLLQMLIVAGRQGHVQKISNQEQWRSQKFGLEQACTTKGPNVAREAQFVVYLACFFNENTLCICKNFGP